MTAMSEFWSETTDFGRGKCLMCQIDPAAASRCARLSLGRRDAHHVIPAQRIRDAFPRGAVVLGVAGLLSPLTREMVDRGASIDPALFVSQEDLLTDVRNGICLGRWHHAQLECGAVRLERKDLPPAAETFARVIGMDWSLDRDYGARLERVA